MQELWHRQAMMPSGAQIFENKVGSAPGILFKEG
jgi:molybdopterin-biosynthesis enzyme MoeA-like protein